MKSFLTLFSFVVVIVVTVAPAQAGALREMMMAKKLGSASSQQQAPATAVPGTTVPAPAVTQPPAVDSKFENAKKKCAELGNKEGSNKFNNCVVTLME